jgi:hypothetical protein
MKNKIKKNIISLFVLTAFILNTGCTKKDTLSQQRTVSQENSINQSTQEQIGLSRSSQPEKNRLISKGRYALIIGNSGYSGNAKLNNPKEDAKDIAELLKNSLGFDVLTGQDLTRSEIQGLIKQFTQKLIKDPQALAFFYYAGHGVEIAGKNYLLPVNESFNSKYDVEDNGISVNTLLKRINDAKSGANVVILDACRNNPWARSWGTRSITGSGGLAKMEAPSGFLIAYAAEPGETASDGVAGSNGLYTKHLLKHLHTHNITLEQVFKRTRSGVENESQGRQRPRETQALTGEDIYLGGKEKTYGKVELQAIYASLDDSSVLSVIQLTCATHVN